MKSVFKLLLALLAVRLVLMAVVPVFEPSEARYAAISANMARSGDFVVPRFTYNCEYQSFDGKPPLVFQAGGLMVKGLKGLRVKGLEGLGPYALQFAVRVFPLLSALLLLAILFHAVKVTADGEAAKLAVVICATCTAFYAAAGMSMTDMTLTCCVAGALLLYECLTKELKFGVKVEERNDHHSSTSTFHFNFFYAAGVAALLGAGMIVKGPVALVMFGLPVLVDAIVNKHWKLIFTWKWLAVAPLFFVIAVPWFVLVEQRNPGAVWYFFYNENFMRFISHDYGDKYGAGREAFRGVSILWALVATLPWVLLPVWEGLRGLRSLRGSAVGLSPFPLTFIKQFDVLALLAIVGFWCLTSRVLLYYLFPVIPLFAAALAKSGDRALLKRLVPWCAGLTAVTLSAALIVGMLCSEKMQGAKTPFDYRENHYANEFYHGTKPPEELAKQRAAYDKLMAQIERWKKMQREAKEKKKGEGER